MKLGQKEKEVLEIIRNLSGENIERISNIFLAFMIYATMCYTESEEVILPYFGKWITKYEGDVETPDGKEAQVNIFALPGDYYKQIIGEYVDFKNKKLSSLDEISIIKYFKKENERSLRNILNDEVIGEIDG
jgi:predicted PolB exonuclease-like 3'-5' exonuclease